MMISHFKHPSVYPCEVVLKCFEIVPIEKIEGAINLNWAKIVQSKLVME